MGIVLFFSTLIAYQLLFTRVDDLVAETSKEINKQVILNYENYLSSVIDTSSTLQRYIIEHSWNDDFESLDYLFNSASNILSNTVSIILLDEMGAPLASSRYDGIKPGYNGYAWFKQAVSNIDIHHFSGPHIQMISANGDQEVFTISKSVNYLDGGVYRSGVLVLDIQTDGLVSLVDKTNLGTEGHILISSLDGDIVFSSKAGCVDISCESAQLVSSMILGGKPHRVDGVEMYVNVSTISATRWKIATFMDVDAIANMKHHMVINLVIAFLVTSFLIALASALVSKRINQPMQKIRKAINALEQGDFETSLEVKGQREFVDLAHAFGDMRLRIRALMNQVVQEQQEKQQTQFRALQNQINPHFLYNTLDSIVWLSENNRNHDVEKAIIALSKFFRMSISGDENVVTLQEEVEHVFNYLLIQQIRYQNQFNFELQIDEKTKDNKVLKLSLQPLVENAIIHGIRPEDGFKKILIRSWMDDTHTYVEVFNEGYGLTPSMIASLRANIQSNRNTSSMGLRNVYQRLKLLYGPESDLYFESELDENTRVTIVMPHKRKGDL